MPTLYPVWAHTEAHTPIDLCQCISMEIWLFLASPIICFFSTTQSEKVKAKISQLCPTLCQPMDFIVHGILQARILEWVAIPFFRGSSQPRDRTQVSQIAGEFFTIWATREAQTGSTPKSSITKSCWSELEPHPLPSQERL